MSQPSADRVTLLEMFDHPRVHIGRAAHGGCVAEMLCNDDDSLYLGAVTTCARLRHGVILGQRRGRQYGGRPGPEILRREFLSRRRLDVDVHVVGANVDPPSTLLIREEVWPTGTATPQRRHHLACRRIADLESPLNGSLGWIVEGHQAIVDSDVFLSETCHTEGLVFQGVILVPYTEISDIEQADDGRKHALSTEIPFSQITPYSRPKVGQSRPEAFYSGELLSISILPPLVVVAVLASPGRVDANGLNVAVRPGADPNVRPGRREHKLADALEGLLIRDTSAIGVCIAEASAAAPP